jgi:hypothetical protein
MVQRPSMAKKAAKLPRSILRRKPNETNSQAANAGANCPAWALARPHRGTSSPSRVRTTATASPSAAMFSVSRTQVCTTYATSGPRRRYGGDSTTVKGGQPDAAFENCWAAR